MSDKKLDPRPMAIDFRSFDHTTCPRCGDERTGGSHYHCGRCDGHDETSYLGHCNDGGKCA